HSYLTQTSTPLSLTTHSIPTRRSSDLNNPPAEESCFKPCLLEEFNPENISNDESLQSLDQKRRNCGSGQCTHDIRPVRCVISKYGKEHKYHKKQKYAGYLLH